MTADYQVKWQDRGAPKTASKRSKVKLRWAVVAAIRTNGPRTVKAWFRTKKEALDAVDRNWAAGGALKNDPLWRLPTVCAVHKQ